MPQEKLDLVQFSTREATQPGTRAPQIVRRQFVDAGASRTEYAWAFDLLIDRPVSRECATIGKWLADHSVFAGARLLDAGCGTGRYAIELARRGYVVQGIDVSPELIAEARQAIARASGAVSCSVGDILMLSSARYDAILCRGVLNDVLDDHARQDVLASFARALRPAGVLVLDVREWEATARRKAREPLFTKSVPTDRGRLTFTSVTKIDPTGRRLIISERHVLRSESHEQSSDHVFVMRCWTHDELHAKLYLSGFHPLAYFGAYDAAVPVGATDRLVAVARRSADVP
ncbi:MAG: class I SAM-dependent methyltransferase [Vicinamibacteraceae bacterium]